MPLPEPVPDLHALDLLVSVQELGSISAAAAAHGVTQPAASMRLRSLERLFGIPLLERGTSGTRLTPAGSATVEWASAVLEATRTLLTGTAALRADRSSHLRLAASMTVAEYLLPRWLQQFAADVPGTQVSLEMGNTAHVCDLVARREVDLGFIEGPRPPGRLRSRELLADELTILVAPGHPWSRRRRPLTPQELAATSLVLREPGSGTREVLTEALEEHGLEPTPAIELGSTTAIKAAAAGRVGPAVISSLAVRGELESGQLIAVPYRGLALRRVIRAIWAPSLPPASAALGLIAIAARSDNRPDLYSHRRDEGAPRGLTAIAASGQVHPLSQRSPRSCSPPPGRP
jgi:DNA-binding transcriptional LysR family regulator